MSQEAHERRRLAAGKHSKYIQDKMHPTCLLAVKDTHNACLQGKKNTGHCWSVILKYNMQLKNEGFSEVKVWKQEVNMEFNICQRVNTSNNHMQCVGLYC